ncbi:MAG: hypothetical protein ABIY55_17435 [Kofleriaceae bacterium]
MHTRWLVVVAAAGACVPVPPFRDDAQPMPPQQAVLLNVNRETGETASTSDAPILYAVRFSDRGVRMPEAIIVEGEDVLQSGVCPYESGVGITVYPMFSASPGYVGTDPLNTLSVDWAGPVIARVTVGWSSKYTCNGAVQEASGTSTFTMFPNARIVRHDTAKPATSALVIDGVQCGCLKDDNFNFSSFWAFQPTTQTVLRDGTAWTDGTSALGCAVYPHHTIGVGFSDPTHARLFTGTGAAAFTYDWEHTATTLPRDERQTTTAILLSKETQVSRCGDVTAELLDPQITIGGVQIGTDDSGIYPGPARQTTPYQIRSPVPLPRGFAVSLDLGAVPVVESSSPVTGAWYAAQVEGDRVLLWFRDGLAVGETITIDPR